MMEYDYLTWKMATFPGKKGVGQQPTDFLEKRRRLQLTRRSEAVLLSVNSQGELPGNRGYDESVKIRAPEKVKKACLQYSTGDSICRAGAREPEKWNQAGMVAGMDHCPELQPSNDAI
jgi:hypothetical protein